MGLPKVTQMLLELGEQDAGEGGPCQARLEARDQRGGALCQHKEIHGTHPTPDTPRGESKKETGQQQAHSARMSGASQAQNTSSEEGIPTHPDQTGSLPQRSCRD